MTKLYEIDGKRWIKISDAARLLCTNAVGVRQMMGDGTLDWCQSRANSRTLVVNRDAVIAMVNAKPFTAPKGPLIKDNKTKMADRMPRVRGELWINHHLRLTLPTVESHGARKHKKADPGSSPG